MALYPIFYCPYPYPTPLTFSYPYPYPCPYPYFQPLIHTCPR